MHRISFSIFSAPMFVLVMFSATGSTEENSKCTEQLNAIFSEGVTELKIQSPSAASGSMKVKTQAHTILRQELAHEEKFQVRRESGTYTAWFKTLNGKKTADIVFDEYAAILGFRIHNSGQNQDKCLATNLAAPAGRRGIRW